MSRAKRRPFLHTEHGVALLELGIVFPLLFLLLAGTYEVSRGISTRNSGEVFAQEAARALFHECKDKDVSDGVEYTAAEAQACVRNELQAIHTYFKRNHPRSAVVASIFRVGPGGLEQFAGPEVSCTMATDDIGRFDCADYTGRYSLARAETELRQLANKTGWVVVVETYVKSSSILTDVLAPVHLENVTHYSVAII